MSQFGFVEAEWPPVHEAAVRAESLARTDPRAACFYARRSLELAVRWVFKHDAALKLPYQDHLSALIHEPTFAKAAGPAVFAKARVVKDLGNQAVHSHKPVREFDAVAATRELFHVLFWLARSYSRGVPPGDALRFDAARLPAGTPVPKQTLEQLQRLEGELRDRDEKLATLLADKATLDEELQRLRTEIAEVRRRNAERPDSHDYSEAETRDYFIDLLLKEAGWALDRPEDREYPVTGMPSGSGDGFVDYVLWGADGLPLAVVEAKRTKHDPRQGQQQAKLYADCLERQFGRRPVIYYTNGYEHWLWDDLEYPPREVQGFQERDELELMIQRRSSRRRMSEAEIAPAIVERHYQTRAIRRIAEHFERDKARKALVVMATGAGKTRTVIALADLLMRCNWAKRVLFLADRTALVTQAVGAFKKHLPDSSPVNLITERDKEGRVYVSTYPTMMGLIEDRRDGRRRFGVGHFDLVVIDEAHRSVYRKYRAIFDYFDSLLVGLTATPKEEIDRNTYGLFDLETGVPTDVYGLDEAVRDGFLVPPKAVSVPLKFQRGGIAYDDLSDDEKEQWDALEWGGDEPPDRVEAEAVNKWLFNTDTVDKVLEHLMTRGLKVAGGDRLGKTIVFAKNHAHAAFVAERFDANYPHHRGEFARVVDFETKYVQSLIDSFSKPDAMPHIAISVDMLDTGIDVPEVLNLVFFKLVRSKTKFWQMIGRGTRLRPDLFGPGRDKKFFQVFDYCGNLEFFSQNPDETGGAVGESLGTRLFRTRLELIVVLDSRQGDGGHSDRSRQGEAEVRRETAELLCREVAAMNVENFVVRPQRKRVETFREPSAWESLTPDTAAELGHSLAGLPTELPPEDEEAKRFDLLVLNLQLALLRAEPSFERLQRQLVQIAGLLEEKAAIPMVAREMALILDVQSDVWWQDVTAGMLETVRRRLRALVKLIEKQRRLPVFTNFEDELGPEATVAFPEFAGADGFDRFRDKVRAFLRQHVEHPTIGRLRRNEPLRPEDHEALERLLSEGGIGTDEDLHRAVEQCRGLGLFVRSLVGLDREAAKQAFAGFLAGRTLTANQIEFVNMIVDHLAAHGDLDAAVLYESPFTDIHPQGPDGVFLAPQVDELLQVIEDVRSTAAV